MKIRLPNLGSGIGTEANPALLTRLYIDEHFRPSLKALRAASHPPGGLINEDKNMLSGKESAGSSFKSDDPQKAGFPAGVFAAKTTTATNAPLNRAADRFSRRKESQRARISPFYLNQDQQKNMEVPLA